MPDGDGPCVPGGDSHRGRGGRGGRAVREAPGSGAEVFRFTLGARWVHHTTALLMGACILSAACLYLPALAQLAGRRELLVTVHEWCGLMLPAPFLLGLGSYAFRADLRLLNRFGPHDRDWLRAALRRQPGRRAGKFNAGQKIWAGWIAGAVLVLTGTGLLMWFTGLAPLAWRTAATFVHDWLALAVGVVLLGHITMAMRDPEARRGMRTGRVATYWARREHPLWRPAGEPPVDDGQAGEHAAAERSREDLPAGE